MCFLAPFTSVAQPASTSVRFRSTRPLDEPWVIQDSSNLPWRSPTPRITAQHSYDVAPGSPAPKRKRGRPRSVKEAVLGPKRPRGRPRKLAVDGENEIPLRKRPVGRPPKEKTMRGVQIELGTIVSCLFFLSTLAACSNTEQNMPGAIHRSAAQAVLPAPPPQSHPCPSEQPAHFATPSNHANDSTSGCPSAHLVIPREDPQQEVELDEDELDGVGDGIGEDDEGEDDEDEDEDEDEDDCSGRAAPSSTRKPGRARHPLPPWLQTAFEAAVAQCEDRDSDGIPRIYSRDRTFWSRQTAAYFNLQGNHPSPSAIYRPEFFLWDIQALHKNLQCPDCHHTLHRHSIISRPRRCVGINAPFWIVGYRYRCRRCKHPKSQKHTVTWRSWDPRILASLPPALAAEFPAKLSHRSGISNSLFDWMRSCFQNGMGAKQFSDALLVQNLLRYDELHLQYLDFLAHRCQALDRFTLVKYKSFLPFDDRSPDGYHGFVPSSQWLRDVYDNFIEEHRHDFNQHMGMLTAEICAIDHSHKASKHI